VIPYRQAARLGQVALIIAAALFSVASSAQAPPADAPAQPAKPKVYALLAAIGEKFTVVTEVSRTGTHLAPFTRRTEDIPGNVLNALALNSLDQGIARADPTSKRVYLTGSAPTVDGVAPSQRETVAIDQIRHSLEGMPQRADWDRIVVALPAYRTLELNGLGPKLQGFGLFAESQCQAGCGGKDRIETTRQFDPEPLDGVDALTSDNKPIKARTFVAPYSYIAVWVLDPKTLEVLDRQEGFDSQKLAEHPSKPMDPSQTQQYIAMRVANLIDTSIETAVENSVVNARRGVVEVGPGREVNPGDPNAGETPK
jgi:hypothetical protein